MLQSFLETPHRRYNPLTREWILVSPHRLQRPWQGKVEDLPPENRPRRDPKCYLCPGNERAGGHRNPDYGGTYVFTNDFAALLPRATPHAISLHDGLIRAQSERGTCRVICFSPRHDLTLAEMEETDIRRVIDVWADQYDELAAEDHISSIQIFENKGQLMGCSNPHPHGQIWATEELPTEVAKEDDAQREYADAHYGRTLLDDYLETELGLRERVVYENESWAVVVPFWAKWPFEAMVLSKDSVKRITDLDGAPRDRLASALRSLTTRYDNLFRVSFPYTMGIHQAPADGEDNDHWRLHFHFYPPLLRSATVQKFMVGFEMLGMPQRDLTPESAAQRLRELPETHYRSETLER